MLIFNETTELFLKRVRLLTKSILNDELGMNYKRTRVTYKAHSYPLNFVCFENPKILAYFEETTFTLGFNKVLIYKTKEKVLKNIIRHELLHFLLFVKSDNPEQAHGVAYRDLARSFNYGADVYSAKANLEFENDILQGDLKAEKIISTIKKLFSLAQSDNKNEAELATRKANQLLLKYNLSELEILKDGTNQDHTSRELLTKRVFSSKRINSKMQSLCSILRLFYVYPVINQTSKDTYLEISGSRTNVLLGEYICQFLDREFERLWLQVSKGPPYLKGLKAKNNFFQGLAQGYAEKVKNDQSSLDSNSTRGLILLQNDLQENIHRAYPHLRFSSSQTKDDPRGRSLGKSFGKNLNINRGLSSNHSGPTLFLT